MKNNIGLITILIILLVGCSAREIPKATTVTESTPAAMPAVTPAPTPARAVTTPPPGAATVSSELIGNTSDCAAKDDCVSYAEKDGTSGVLCAYYDDVGCYHYYACNPSGEVVQKETPAYCGR